MFFSIDRIEDGRAVLIGQDHQPLASGGHDWENRLEDGVWTYHLEDVWTGLQANHRRENDVACANKQREGHKAQSDDVTRF